MSQYSQHLTEPMLSLNVHPNASILPPTSFSLHSSGRSLTRTRNANETILNETNLDGVARIADAFRPYGVQLGLSLYFASPEALGGLDTFDPLNDTVVEWWNDKTNQIYEKIPDFAGYLVKANSEGQPGPITYNRTLADGANLFARALKPHGGIIMFRAFVYDHESLNQTLNWKADRANAAVEFFDGLDDQFEDNVVVQIKYG